MSLLLTRRRVAAFDFFTAFAFLAEVEEDGVSDRGRFIFPTTSFFLLDAWRTQAAMTSMQIY